MSKLNGLRKKRQAIWAKSLTKKPKLSDIPFMSSDYQLDEEQQTDVPEEVYKTFRRLELERA